jgi:hypothetical protein
MTDTTQVATEIRHLITAGTAEQELLVWVARKFPDLTPAELSEALQDATAAAERRMATAKH